MDEKEHKLLVQMVLKINEAKTYNKISFVISVLWLFEFFYSFFVIQTFNFLYWLVWIVCLIGWVHMDRKFKTAMKEYEQLKKDYENNF